MKLQLISDLHLEMFEDYGESCLRSLIPAANTLVVAGDLARADKKLALDRAFSYFCANWRSVIYVPGNHEYYLSSPESAAVVMQSLREKFSNSLYVFSRPGSIKIDGRLLFCGTMWFPYETLNSIYAKYLSDFSCITKFVPWVYEQNEVFRKLLYRNLEHGSIVITHHLPSTKSVSPDYSSSPLNRFFVSDMEALIFDRSPSLWLHGHTHTACDYFLGKTRIVANPRGYYYENSVQTFNTGLVLEV